MSATTAPRIEIYTFLACSVHKPDIFDRTLRLGGYVRFPNEPSPHLVLRPVIPGVQTFSYAITANPCASDPVVQAAVAILTAGEFGMCT